MVVNRKMLALLTAAIVGTGLAACQRSGDQSASSQDSSSMNQAPKQGYTGPANPSTSPPSSSDSSSTTQGQSSGDNTTGSPGSANPSPSQNPPQNQDQSQQQR